MCYSMFFGVLSVILTGAAYVLLFDNIPWHPYLLWLIAINAVTFVMYGIDSVFGKQGKAETPETVMHLLSAAGGFVGAGLGRAVFRYKVDWPEGSWGQILLFVTAVGHIVLAYTLLIKGPD